ncbi:hypothetical protein OG429_38725 [Streptomyces sp. NBC_00190]|uniref:hypothetical protein n=1 Tax=unclassified Streptomyces TaxID=2593676 RepID=UPI002E2DC49F|nr:hypothetical protein [Streptomyces sp. NBC_00190]WSZ44673.1 hypothetical protein OG239_41155 [Streptomyces sp. NBC_00868]
MAQTRFPEDLIQLKRQEIRSFNRLVRRPETETTELRSELTRLSCLIGSHPHWQSEPLNGRARSDLHHQAVATPGGEPELVVEYRDGKFVVHAPETCPHSS